MTFIDWVRKRQRKRSLEVPSQHFIPLEVQASSIFAELTIGGNFTHSDPSFPEYSDPSKSWVVFGYKPIFIIFSRGLESKMRGVNF